MVRKKPENMTAIVQYTDGIVYRCKTTDIGGQKNNLQTVRYTDRRKYAARLLFFSGNHDILDQIQSHLEGRVPQACLPTISYTGTRLSSAEILLQAKKILKDQTKLFISEIMVLNEGDTPSQRYNLDILQETFTDSAQDVEFLEAIIDSGPQCNALPDSRKWHSLDRIPHIYLEPVAVTEALPQISQPTKKLQDVSLNNNGDAAMHEENNVQCDKDHTSLIPVAPHLSNLTPGSLAETDQKLDHNGQSSVAAARIEPAIEVSEEIPSKNTGAESNAERDEDHASSISAAPHLANFPTEIPPKNTGEDVIQSTKEFEENPGLTNPSEPEPIFKVPRQSAISKPRIINEEIGHFDPMRMKFFPNTNYETGNISIIGGQLDTQASAMQVLNADGIEDIDLMLDIINAASGGLNDLDAPTSFETDDPVMSSTVVESSTLRENEKDSNDSSSDKDEDEDYEPLEEEEQSDTESSEEETPSPRIPNVSTVDDPSVLDVSIGKTSAPDDTNMRVATSATPSHTKKQFCYYCKTMQTKLARHLENQHSKEEDVKKFINLPKRNQERQDIIALIRKKGNHLFNTDRRFNDGNLLVCRRPNKRMKKTAVDFMACAKCKGQYARSVIRHHWRKCTKRVGKADRIVMVKGRAVMGRFHEKANELVKTYVFPYLREDDVVRAIRYDEILILYANKQSDEFGTHQHQYQMVRARLRLMGRVLLAMKNLDSSITDFASIYNPKSYDNILRATKSVAKFDAKTHTFEHPAVASHVGTLLKHVGELLRSECIKSEDEKKQKKVEDFLKLMAENFGSSINRAVAETQMQNNRRKKVELPSIDDIKKLFDFLKARSEDCMTKINEKFTYSTWLKLAEVTLISLQIFNRRRAGEIERIYVEDFESYQSIDSSTNKGVFNTLSKDDQSAAQKYVRFMIRGKRGRGVPVLVPSDLLQSMKIILKFRKEAKVPKHNPYFFGLPCIDNQRKKFLSACDLLREFSVACGAKVPESLRGTKLRKHIATHCINLNLSETQVTDLANFMGHHEKIHKEIYRQPIVERDITKMSKLLECAVGLDSGDEDEETDSDEETTGNNQTGEDITPLETPASDSKSQPIQVLGKAKAGSKRKMDQTDSCSKNKIRRVSDHGSTRRSWSNAEKSIVLEVFGKFINGKKLPSLGEIGQVITDNKCLQGRTAPQVKTWLHNQRKKSLR